MQGLSDYRVADRTGVSRNTVMRWRRDGFPQLSAPADHWSPAGEHYSYLLGIYLGDGSISFPGRCKTPRLDVACDSRYRAVVSHITNALGRVFPQALVRTDHVPNSHCLHLRITDPSLIGAFPQHGPGKKHERKIELAEWQRVLTHRYPEALIRGLIHSDGSRCINRFKTELPSGRVSAYEYVRYFFTNYSADIRQIFREHCELLGIRCTQSNSRNLSISDQGSVAILERIVGPKT
jgi:hypothetical protein